MQVERIGFTPLKGTRHVTHGSVRLAASGPVGDRVFCLVDPERSRVLRTVENPGLTRAASRWAGGVLSVDVAGATLTGAPEPTGRMLRADYWGRAAELEEVDGPWAAAFSEYLGYDVLLARSAAPGEVVYGGSVTLVSAGSLHLLAERLADGGAHGAAVDDARFRSTFRLDGGEPHVEDSWVGRRLRLGGAVVRVTGRVPRCAVVDVGPDTGVRDSPVLKTLAGYRREDQDVHFGVDAVVVEPGAVRRGDAAELERG